MYYPTSILISLGLVWPYIPQSLVNGRSLLGVSLHHTTLNHTKPHYTTLHYAKPHHTTLHYTTPLHTTPRYTTPHYTTPHHTTPHHTTPHHTTLHYTTLHHTTQHYTTLYCTYSHILVHQTQSNVLWFPSTAHHTGWDQEKSQPTWILKNNTNEWKSTLYYLITPTNLLQPLKVITLVVQWSYSLLLVLYI